VPLPVPLPDVTVIHATLLVALHPQPLVVVTLAVFAPPAAVAESLSGDTA
jgi:hypothetical protein